MADNSYLFPEMAPKPKKRASTPVTNIISRSKKIWEDRFGVRSFAHHARMGAVAKALLDAYTEDEIVGAWDVYVSGLKDPKFGNPQSFRSAIGSHVLSWKLKTQSVVMSPGRLLGSGEETTGDEQCLTPSPDTIAACMIPYHQSVTGVATESTPERIELAKRAIAMRGISNACVAIKGAARYARAKFGFVATFESVFGSDSGFERFFAIGCEESTSDTGRLYME